MHGILISNKQIVNHFEPFPITHKTRETKNEKKKRKSRYKILFCLSLARLMLNYIPMQISFFPLIFSLNHDDLTEKKHTHTLNTDATTSIRALCKERVVWPVIALVPEVTVPSGEGQAKGREGERSGDTFSLFVCFRW